MSISNFKEQFLTEDDLSDLLWLVDQYGDNLEKVAHDDNYKTLAAKLEKMLDSMG